jgi:NTP pyrophosphatase (non-canonical NTP hydrolase)
MTGALTFDAAQARVWDNKVARGFNTTSVEREFCLTMGELGEAYTAWRKTAPPRPPRWRRMLAALRIRRLPRAVAPPPVRDEVADAMIFLLGLAEMLGFKASAAVAEKMAVNEARRYRQLPGGTHAKVS